MLTRISEWLHSISSNSITLAALVVLVLFMALVLPQQQAPSAARETAGFESADGRVGGPDLSFWYSVKDLYRWADAYGAEGRQAYIQARFSFDLVWPLVYGAFLTTALSWLFGRVFAAGSRWRLLNLVPVAGVLLDYLENVSASVVMGRFPLRTPGVAHLAPVFTATKWVCVGGSFVLLVVGIVAYALHLRKRNAT
jgi:hypothetical protein